MNKTRYVRQFDRPIHYTHYDVINNPITRRSYVSLVSHLQEQYFRHNYSFKPEYKNITQASKGMIGTLVRTHNRRYEPMEWRA